MIKTKNTCSNELITYYINNYYNLLKYSLSICKQKELSEDVLQDVFLSLYSRKKKLIVKNIEPYLVRSIKLNSLSKIRQRNLSEYNGYSNHNSIIEKYSFNHSDFLMEKIITREIDSLPLRRRKVFILKRLNKKTTKEVSETLNISTKTVENHLSLATKQLKSKLISLTQKQI